VGLAVVLSLTVVAPWVIRNEHVLGAVTLADDDGVTLAWSNCPPTYGGSELGYFDARCAPGRLPGNEGQQAAALRRRGLNYARRHVGRLALVVLARVAGTWGLFHPFRGSSAAGRNVTVSDIGVVVFYPLALLALAGAWSLRRRRGELWVLLAPFVLVTVTAAATFGSLRLRYLAELPLTVLAGVGLAALLRAQPSPSGSRQPMSPGSSSAACGPHEPCS
jgi:hypothetical protein